MYRIQIQQFYDNNSSTNERCVCFPKPQSDDSELSTRSRFAKCILYSIIYIFYLFLSRFLFFEKFQNSLERWYVEYFIPIFSAALAWRCGTVYECNCTAGGLSAVKRQRFEIKQKVERRSLFWLQWPNKTLCQFFV